MIPTITTATKSGKESSDLFSLDFTENRRIWIIGEINNAVAAETIIQLEYLDRTGDGDITLCLNSPGGSVSAGFAIVDAMNRCKNDVSTVCTGVAASMAAFILACGAKGKRYATPLSEVMIHQPLGGVQGQATDIQLAAAHICSTKDTLNNILAQQTGRSPLEISRDTDRDTYLPARQAVEYGLVDAII